MPPAPPAPPSPPFVVSADAVAALIQAGSSAQPAAETRSVIGRRLRSWARRLAGALPEEASAAAQPRQPEGGSQPGRQLQQELLTPYGDSGVADPLALARGDSSFNGLAAGGSAGFGGDPAVPRLLQEGLVPPGVLPGLLPAAATVPLLDPVTGLPLEAPPVDPVTGLPLEAPPLEPAPPPITIIGGELPVPAVANVTELPPLVDVAAAPPNPGSELALGDVFLRCVIACE